MIRPNEDRYIEGIENLVLTVAPGDTFLMAAPVEVEILIIDNEFPVISIAAVDAVAMEEEENDGDNRARLLVSRTGDHSGDLTVNYLVSGSANKGLDYEPLSGSVVIRAGDISAGFVSLPRRTRRLKGMSTWWFISPTARFTIVILRILPLS